MRRGRPGLGLLVSVLTIVAAIAGGLAVAIRLDQARAASPPSLGGTVSLAEALGGTAAQGYERALAPRA